MDVALKIGLAILKKRLLPCEVAGHILVRSCPRNGMVSTTGSSSDITMTSATPVTVLFVSQNRRMFRAPFD
jgi:hypothetical protein